MARRIEPKLVVVEVEVPVMEQCERGKICLDRGEHAITIITKGKPRKVFFGFDEEQSLPVCMGDMDYVGTTLLPDGFVLYAKISSNNRCIRWCAVEE